MHAARKEVAKTVVLRGGEKNLFAVLPASYHINLKKLSALASVPVGLLAEKECNKLLLDCEPGAIPPCGELYRLPVYLDEVLAEDPEIICSVGTHSEAIRMGNADFVRLARPRVCTFADRLWTI